MFFQLRGGSQLRCSSTEMLHEAAQVSVNLPKRTRWGVMQFPTVPDLVALVGLRRKSSELKLLEPSSSTEKKAFCRELVRGNEDSF